MPIEKLLRPEILVFLVGGIVAVTAIVVHAWADYTRRQEDNRLKAMMIEQGRSAEEIERVLAASKEHGCRVEKRTPANETRVAAG